MQTNFKQSILFVCDNTDIKKIISSRYLNELIVPSKFVVILILKITSRIILLTIYIDQ